MLPDTSAVVCCDEDVVSDYQAWAMTNYGDNGKTKTVTRKKYDKIKRILTGEEQSSPDNSKLRFWIRAKGLRLGRTDDEHGQGTAAADAVPHLYIPVKKTFLSPSAASTVKLRRVAIVEDFFSIIHSIHVDMQGLGGKHAGQKRTYKAVAESFAFLPREAVTRFLMLCSHCKRRMQFKHSDDVIECPNDNSSEEPDHVMLHSQGADGTNDDSSRLHGGQLPREGDQCEMSSVQNHSKNGDEGAAAAAAALQTTLAGKPPTTSELQATTKDELSIVNCKSGDMKSSCLLGILGGSDMATKNPNKRRHSTDSIDSSTTRVSNLEENREDDDNDDDDDDDRLQALDVDPERLKAFNMFVRLFVDENLDRVIPISKQPKDKVQAILEACDRQFPEFQERSRKRIRTYLKSCRRLKRSKDSNVWEQAKPAPHLTSAAAEGILAQACENESQNAKRMRMGLEPLSACVMNANATMGTLNCGSIQSILTQTDKLPKHGSPSHEKSFHDDRSFIDHKEVKCAHDLPSSNLPNGSSSLQFRPPPPPRMPVTHNALTTAQDPYSKLTQNGPTDLRVKYKAVENGDFQKTKNNLNPTEMATIRQLIAGYRESAAFLYRSADELEQLLLQKN